MLPSTSFYGCGENGMRKNFCYFESLGACSDHQAQAICNKHAAIFGLYYRNNDFVNVNRDHIVRTETYVCSANNLRIGLFIDEKGTTLVDDIIQFARYTEKNFQSYGINAFKLAEIIGSLVGLTAFVTNSEYASRSWLNNPDSYIFRYENNTVTVLEARKLPTLHKILFAHVYPSTEVSDKTDKITARLETLILTLDNATNRFIFTTTNNDMVMKQTIHQNCVATPLVLSGYNKIPTLKDAHTFKSSYNYPTFCSK